jgi:hypothetical protein
LEQKKRDSARAAVLPPSPLSDMTVKLCWRRTREAVWVLSTPPVFLWRTLMLLQEMYNLFFHGNQAAGIIWDVRNYLKHIKQILDRFNFLPN